jgi:16S rRNA (cytosine967-C5)-methyltransferase
MCRSPELALCLCRAARGVLCGRAPLGTGRLVTAAGSCPTRVRCVGQMGTFAAICHQAVFYQLVETSLWAPARAVVSQNLASRFRGGPVARGLRSRKDMEAPTARTHRHARIAQATELLGLILTGRLPADRQMDAYFRGRRQMGSRDRAFAAETVYGCLRRARTLEQIVGPAPLGPLAPRPAPLPTPSPTPSPAPPPAAALVAAWLLAFGGWTAGDLAEAGFPGDADALEARARAFDPSSLPFAVRADLPDWLAERLVAQWGEAEALALAEALNRPATLDIRVNALKTTRAELARRLRADGVEMEPTPLSPAGLRRAERAPLFASASFKDGLFEVQDEGSQLVSLLVEPRPHDRVADFCAGAGGKTLHLGSLMGNTGVLYAVDVSPRRLAEIRPRLRRSGLQTVRAFPIEHEGDRRLKRLQGKLDRVLVDAPCSGTGTLRRNPDIKWRPVDLPGLQEEQQRILQSAARLVKPGGRLVYATCSLLREENEAVVDAFLSEAAGAGFRRVHAGEILRSAGIVASDLVTSRGDLCLLPHRHGTDGFFAVALDRG